MANENSPSSVMYAALKAIGVNNHDAAMLLFDTTSSFGRTTLLNRIESRPQLSRGIVHVAPGDLSVNLFRSFDQSVPQLMGQALASRRIRDAQELIRRFSGPSAHAMQDALQEYAIDDSIYRNTLDRIADMDLKSEMRRAELYFALFVATGCTGDPIMGARVVHQIASKDIPDAFRTMEASIDEPPETPLDHDNDSLGLMRIVGGKLKGGSAFYPLATDERGTEIGAFATGSGDIADVEKDVSRHHARVYRKDGRWFIIGLGSTNGTTVIAGDDKTEHIVEPPRRERHHDFKPEPYELFPTDTICLGASTRFMVMPV